MKQKYFYSILLFFISFFGFSQTLDQENAPAGPGGGGFAVSTTQNVGQSFQAGLSGTLAQVNVYNNDTNTAGDFRLTIYNGDGYGGSIVGTQNFTITSAPTGEYVIPISSIINITAGNFYTIRLDGVTTGNGNFLAPSGDIYANGTLYYGSGSAFSSYDLWFKTFINTPSPATHLNFNGVNDFVTLNNESNFDFTNQMTVEFWMNSNVMPEQWDALVVKGDNSWRVALTETGTVAFTGTNAFSDFFSLTSVTDGNWHHVAVTYDGANAKIYIDGSLESQSVGSANISNSTYTVSLGENLQMTGRKYTGNMDEVRIWNTARTIDQINASKNCELQGNETGLIAYYQFNQGVDQANNTNITTLTDNTATNANNGTLSNFALNGATSNWLAGSPITSNLPVPSIPINTTPVTYTQGDTATALTATTGIGGVGLLWYTTATGGTGSSSAPTPSTATVGSTSYWVSSTNSNGCESDRVEIVVTVNAASTSPAAPTTTWATQVYTGDDKTIADIQVTGSTITWYDAPSGGMVLAPTISLLDGGTAYASQTVGGVESTDRLAVTVKRISDNTQTLPPASTVANLVTTPSAGATAQWFANATGGTPLASTDVLTNGVYYVEQQTVAGVETLGFPFFSPTGVAIQPNGKIVVADTDTSSIKRMDADGTNMVTLGSGFNYPYGIAILADGKIVVADTYNNVIKRMDADGTNMVTLGSGFNRPYGVAIQADGKIVVADTYNNVIKRMDSYGGNIEVLGSGFSIPSGVAIQADGKIVVADSGNGSIKRMDSYGGNIEVLGSGFSYPFGVAIQVGGKIVVADSGNNSIKRMDSNGTNIEILGSGLNSPYGVAIQTDGKIVVADSGNDAIKRITEASTSNRVPVNVVISSPAAPTTTWTTQVYTGDDKTIADIQVTGSNITWYDSPTGGSVLPSTTSLFDGGTAYASQTIGGVESTARLAVTVKRISDNTQTLPPASTVANLVATPSTGTTAQWFANATGGTALAVTDVLTDGIYYVEQQTVAGVETLGSGFYVPFGVAIQPDGKIVVVDYGNDSIKRMDADGTNIETLGSGFSNPRGVAIQADGKIVVADTDTSSIKRMDSVGTNMVTLGSGFYFPFGVAIQADDKIVVADTYNNVIKRMDADGTNMVTLGSGFSYPFGVAIQTTDGKIVVADTNNNAIKRMNADGSNIETLGSGFSYPRGVAIQADGKIVVADSGNNVIKRMNADGTNIETLGGGFSIPSGVAIQTDGKIVVSDSNNNAIKRITEASTSNRVPVSVVISSPAAPTTTWTTQVYTGDDKTIADIQVTGSTITWYDSPTGGSVLAPTISLFDGETAYASQTIGGVESTARLAVTVKRISDNTQTLPPASTVANLVTTPSTGATAQWFANATGGTALAGTDVLTDGIYYVEQVLQSATVSTFVGTIQGNQDGDASTAQFYTPFDTAFDTSGNMYVADYRNHRIRKVTPTGVVSTFAGSTMGYADGNGTSAQFKFPTKLAFDLSGNLLVCDMNNSMIRKITPTGDVTTVAGSTNGYADGNGTAAQFSYPDGIAVNAIGEIFVSDQNNNRVRKIDTAGNVTTFVGDGASNTTDGAGTAASIESPAGMEFDTNGNLIVIEYSSNGNLRKITPTGDVTTIVGGFNYPEDIAIDNMNVIYVADTDNSAIKKVDQFGTVTSYAGGTFGDTDGDIATAEFGYTSGVTFHANELVFCDLANNKIKKISSQTSNRVPVNVDVTTLGTSNFDVHSFKIYPNPSTGIFTIDTKEEVQIEVFDLVGKMIKKENIHIGVNSIDVTNYANGVYLLRVNNSGKINTYRLVKQ